MVPSLPPPPPLSVCVYDSPPSAGLLDILISMGGSEAILGKKKEEENENWLVYKFLPPLLSFFPFPSSSSFSKDVKGA